MEGTPEIRLSQEQLEFSKNYQWHFSSWFKLNLIETKLLVSYPVPRTFLHCFLTWPFLKFLFLFDSFLNFSRIELRVKVQMVLDVNVICCEWKKGMRHHTLCVGYEWECMNLYALHVNKWNLCCMKVLYILSGLIYVFMNDFFEWTLCTSFYVCEWFYREYKYPIYIVIHTTTHIISLYVFHESLEEDLVCFLPIVFVLLFINELLCILHSKCYYGFLLPGVV